MSEFDQYASDHFERAFEEALDAPTERVVIDLGAVTFLDLRAVRPC